MDIVNEDDQVIGSCPLDEIYEKRHVHRVAHVLVYNEAGQLALQLRSATKSFLPGHWCTSAGGRVSAGESYEAAARREAREELGVDLELTFLARPLYRDHERGLSIFQGVYSARHEGPFTVSAREVDLIRFVAVPELHAMIERGEKIHPELLSLVQEGLV